MEFRHIRSIPEPFIAFLSNHQPVQSASPGSANCTIRFPDDRFMLNPSNQPLQAPRTAFFACRIIVFACVPGREPRAGPINLARANGHGMSGSRRRRRHGPACRTHRGTAENTTEHHNTSAALSNSRQKTWPTRDASRRILLPPPTTGGSAPAALLNDQDRFPISRDRGRAGRWARSLAPAAS